MILQIIAVTLVVAGLAGLALAAGLWWLKSRENRRLDRIVADLGLRMLPRRDAVLAANRWVYRNKGFGKNPHVFVSRRLGPTATHVLDLGGDCADKSRLTMALLDRAGVPSTLAMLYGSADGPPTHVIVEARYEHGRMAVDPVFDIDFPADATGERYFGIKELRADPKILVDRVRELSEQRGASDDKVSYYKLATEHYSHARTMNLDKNALTRAVAALLERLGQDPTLVPRPVVLEDPIRLCAMGATIAGSAAVTIGLWLL
jgi:hypothetical protein